MTYQLLLVDDESIAVEGVKSDLNVQKLGITKLFTAYSMKQAMKVFEEEFIDIMVCDIEMPQGSGLDLLAWVRETYPDTATIFLTSHADFKYAKEAMQLGSIDYLLKPVLASDLENAIRKAQSAIDRNSENSRNSESHQLWLKHHSLIIERFWLDLINQSTQSHPDAIQEQVERHHIPITEQSMFLPILISVQRWIKPLKRRDEKIMEYALKNSAEELIIGNDNGICLQLDRGLLLVILSGTKDYDWDYDRLVAAGQAYIASCTRYFYCELSCYLGMPAGTVDMAEMTAMLREKDNNNVAFANHVFKYNHEGAAGVPSSAPAPWSGMVSLLKSGSKEAVVAEAEKLLQELVRKQEMDAGILNRFYQDFIQSLYSFLNMRGVQAHQLFGDDESRQIADKARRSVVDMLIWVRYTVDKAMFQAEAAKETDTVVETVKRFIELNMDQDLSREKIAEQVFLNPDYLTRIFKKETGYSVSDYVLLERINTAKELLAQTNTPISSIAATVGYTNFSHFAKIFKKYAGTGPTEYRSQFGGGKS